MLLCASLLWPVALPGSQSCHETGPSVVSFKPRLAAATCLQHLPAFQPHRHRPAAGASCVHCQLRQRNSHHGAATRGVCQLTKVSEEGISAHECSVQVSAAATVPAGPQRRLPAASLCWAARALSQFRAPKPLGSTCRRFCSEEGNEEVAAAARAALSQPGADPAAVYRLVIGAARRDGLDCIHPCIDAVLLPSEVGGAGWWVAVPCCVGRHVSAAAPLGLSNIHA